MEAADNPVVVASSSSSQRNRKRRIRRRRRRRKEKRVIAPSSLPNELIEEIFLRLPVKVLVRLRSLSKQWKVALESLSFAERHLKIAKQSRMDLMVIDSRLRPKPPRPYINVGFRVFCLESGSVLSFTLINFSQGFGNWIYVSGNCDGLFCIHSPRTQSIYVVNPATRWLRQLPPARFQILMHKFNPTLQEWIAMDSVFHLAFVKASAADYKLVWLYNSHRYNADALCPNEGVTKCEVFDFRANTWRYLSCTPSYRIFPTQKPAYANGSVYWLTELHEARIKVVDFDIRTETFRLLPKIIPGIDGLGPRHIELCTLDNHLCMSKREHVTKIQNIWRLKPSEDTWEKIFSIDLLSCPSPQTEILDQFEWSHKDLVEPSTPVAVCKNKKILLSHSRSRGLVKYDPLTKSLDFFYWDPMAWRKVTYFQSMISHI
ncbi:putative F-box/kelch-repeat protein [Raphanus sativus]|uniref:F-box/kelch-repeat protein At1g13200 n=1 Tax=Raphanus sativus TaxID=3726 RepID=A0A6J0KRY4_RAPSA|nr:putative F-box/kelch-repeat protein At1g13200 [Raphanus sativus]KAJ4879275.1 putative F-box/kelch-repeat protein [Raphanus sativus]